MAWSKKSLCHVWRVTCRGSWDPRPCQVKEQAGQCPNHNVSSVNLSHGSSANVGAVLRGPMVQKDLSEVVVG